MKTIEEIYSEMTADFSARTGVELAADGDMAVRLYAVAAQIYSLYVQSEWVARQCFPQTAVGEYLDRHASLRGVERRQAAKAVGTLRFSVTEGHSTDLTVPAGTVCMTAGLIRFETLKEAVISAGSLSVDVPAQAVEAGMAGNVASNTVLSMAVAPVGVSGVNNPEPFTGGVEEEEDEALRARVLETFRRLPNGANAAFYEQGALSFSQVAAANVIPRDRGIGTVDVVIATDSGLPDAELIAQVQEYFEERREIAVDVQVLAPTAQSVDVTVQVKAMDGKDAAAVQQAVESTVAGWFNGSRLGCDVLLAELGHLVFETQGVANYAITLPASDVAIAVDQLPVLGKLTVEELA